MIELGVMPLESGTRNTQAVEPSNLFSQIHG